MKGVTQNGKVSEFAGTSSSSVNPRDDRDGDLQGHVQWKARSTCFDSQALQTSPV